MSDKFGSSVVNWTKKADKIGVDVLHHSLRLLVEETTRPKKEGGHMPVVKGNLRNSVQVSRHRVTIDWKRKTKFRDPSDEVNNAVAGIEPGTIAYIGFRAPYAHKVEVKEGFVRLAAQLWPQIVVQAARKKP